MPMSMRAHVAGSGTALSPAAKVPDDTAVKSASLPGGTTSVGGTIEVKLSESPSSAVGLKPRRLELNTTFPTPEDDAFRLAADPEPEKIPFENVPVRRLSPALIVCPPAVTTVGPTYE
jgi:hypothetical protein